MSLINDALKKAQKQREVQTGTPPPGVPLPASSQAGSTSSPDTRPARSPNVTLMVAAAAVLVSGSVAATVYFLRSPTPAAPAAVVSTKTPQLLAPAPATSPSPTPPLASAASAPAPVAPAPQPTAPAPTVALPASTPTVQPSSPVGRGEKPPPAAAAVVSAVPPAPTLPAPTPASAPAQITAPAANPPVASATTLPAAEPAAKPPAVEPAAPVKVTFRIQGMIDKFRISGIRLSDTESKVILNDHLFRADDLVESSLGLRLTKIESHMLTFTDAEGNVYLKRF